jgi:N utilization substance protein B
MKALYQRDVGGGRPEDTLAYLCAEEGVGEEIAAYAQHWRLERLANVDRNILRLGVYELVYRRDVPASVAISEAVELAKVYGGPESGRFVNGVLGQIAREVDAGAESGGGRP